MQYTRYDKTTGRILSKYNVSEKIAAHMIKNGAAIIEGDIDENSQYIDIYSTPPKAKNRPVMPISQDKKQILADGEDTVILSSLPDTCEITIGEQIYNVEDKFFEWSTLMAGTYKIIVQSFPFIPWESEVRAIESDLPTVQ